MIKTKVAVVGGGPVGLFSSLLLQHFNIDHVTFQKFDKPRSHPSAHWVSGRSKQILSQIPNLAQRIDENQQNFDNFRKYRYCQSLFGYQFGQKDHFSPSFTQKMAQTKRLFGSTPNHISQGKLLQILHSEHPNPSILHYNQTITSITPKNNKYHLTNQLNQPICQSQYIILSNGIHSTLRDELNIKMQGEHQLFNIINIHFQCRKLAQRIRQDGKQAMLHFLWNQKMPSILVNHSYQNGVFVLQVPNYQPFLDLTQFYTPRELVSTILSNQQYLHIQNDLKIIHVGKWKLQALLADKLVQQNVFLVGDTAHTFTPAGGFGMNSGFQDANQIIHFIHFAERNPNCDKKKLFQIYNQQRRTVDGKYMKKSLQNYKITQQISEKLGLPQKLTQSYIKLSKSFPPSLLKILPLSKSSIIQSIRLKLMQTFYKRCKFQPSLQLFFNQFDYQINNLSQKSIFTTQQTKLQQVKDIYVNQTVSIQEIQQIFGLVQSRNIQTVMGMKDRIVRRDGVSM